MNRVVFSLVLGLLVGAVPVGVAQDSKPKDSPPAKGPLREKIDPDFNRSLTGVVEKVEAKEDGSGTLKLRSSGPAGATPYQYTFQIDGKTKITDPEGKPLADGLKSRVLAGAAVRVAFVDEKPGGGKAPPKTHFAQEVQLIRAKK